MGGSSKSTKQSWQTTSSGPTQDFINRGNAVLDAATPLANTYTPYTGERVADFNELFQQAQGLVKDKVAAGPQDLNSARSILGQITGSINPNKTAQERMDPYLDGVLAPTLRRLRESGAAARNTLDAQATMAGAFGDAGYGVATAQQLRDQNQALTDVTQQGYSNAFKAGEESRRADLATLLSAGSQYQQLEGADLTRTAALSGLLDQYSNQQRAIDQAKLDASYQKWEVDQNAPLQRLQALMGLIQAAPKTTIGTSQGTEVSTQPNSGGMGILGSLVGSLFNGGSSGFMGSAIGSGLSALGSLFSDERLKEDVRRVGETDDGQPIYRFNYKGGGPSMLGLLADDVEKERPEAVSIEPRTGMKMVDYDAATAGTAGRARTPKGVGVLEELMRMASSPVPPAPAANMNMPPQRPDAGLLQLLSAGA